MKLTLKVGINGKENDYEPIATVDCAKIYPGKMDTTKPLQQGGYRRCYQMRNLTSDRSYINVTLISDNPEVLDALQKDKPIKATIQILEKTSPNGKHKNNVVWAYIKDNQKESLRGSVKFTKNSESRDSIALLPGGYATVVKF